MTDLIADELRLIRISVPGVRGSIAATTDGLLVAHDVPGLEPTQIAALVAAIHAVAVRASWSTECGQLKEVITRGSDGYLAVYAAGSAASGGPRDDRPEHRDAELPGTQDDRAHHGALGQPRQETAGGFGRPVPAGGQDTAPRAPGVSRCPPAAGGVAPPGYDGRRPR